MIKNGSVKRAFACLGLFQHTAPKCRERSLDRSSLRSIEIILHIGARKSANSEICVEICYAAGLLTWLLNGLRRGDVGNFAA